MITSSQEILLTLYETKNCGVANEGGTLIIQGFTLTFEKLLLAANDTQDTRVSLDLRIVPEACFDPDPPDSRGRCIFHHLPLSNTTPEKKKSF